MSIRRTEGAASSNAPRSLAKLRPTPPSTRSAVPWSCRVMRASPISARVVDFSPRMSRACGAGAAAGAGAGGSARVTGASPAAGRLPMNQASTSSATAASASRARVRPPPLRGADGVAVRGRRGGVAPSGCCAPCILAPLLAVDARFWCAAGRRRNPPSGRSRRASGPAARVTHRERCRSCRRCRTSPAGRSPPATRDRRPGPTGRRVAARPAPAGRRSSRCARPSWPGTARGRRG